MTNEDARRARERADLSQLDLALALGISIRSVQRFEYGEAPLAKNRTLHQWFEAIERLRREAGGE